MARGAAQRPFLVLAVFGVLAAAAAAGALTLSAKASTDTLVSSGAESFEATEAYKREFGDEAVVVLVRGDLQRLVLTADLGRLIQLEGCLSGNVPPQGLRALPPVCEELARTHPVRAVYGPGTFINTAVDQIAGGYKARQEQATRNAEQAAQAARDGSARRGLPKRRQKELADAARSLVLEQFRQETFALATRYGLTGVPRIDDPSFVSRLVFDTLKGPNVPKPRFSYLFPSGRAAVVQVRLRPELSEEERGTAIGLVREAVASPSFRLQEGGRYVVTGVPVIAQDLGEEVQRSVLVLLFAGVLLMMLTLALVFRSALRLLPLLLALGAVALTFGALALAGGSLTMASIGALPVLIGLAVDYAIQFHARWNEARVEAAVRGDEEPGHETAFRAASLGGPVIATAGLASGLGFLLLVLSPVPMVRGFGALVVVGVFIALCCALTAGFAALARFGPQRRDLPSDVPPVLPRMRAGARRSAEALHLATLARAGRRGREGASRFGARALRLAITRPERVLLIGLLVALVGWVADSQTRVVSDVRELVPPEMRALKNVTELSDATGVAGEVDVTVHADDLTRPEVIRWMERFQREALAVNGWRPGSSCTQRDDAPSLCPGFSLTDLLGSTNAADRRTIGAVLRAVPPYFSRAVLSRDLHTANIAFGIRLMPLDRQQEVIQSLRDRLNPPPGVTAAVAGAPVLVAEGNAALASPWRRLFTLVAGLALVFLVLYWVRGRRFDAAAVPLMPIALATGWSSFVLWAMHIPLNPLSAALGALVIAISTEFTVLLSARYAEEREKGAGPADALRLTFASTGAAVFASGTTAIAGFAALIASDIRMLRDFGIVTVVDLTVSLLGVMLVLPAALVWSEQHGPIRAQDLDPRRWVAAARSRGGAGRPRARSVLAALGLRGGPRGRA